MSTEEMIEYAELRKMLDSDDPFDRLDATNELRRRELKATYHDDVKRLFKLWAGQSGASDIAGQLLLAVHARHGTIEPFQLRRLDAGNLRAAMRLIASAAVGNIISDWGLTEDASGNPLLTAEQVKAIEKIRRRSGSRR